MLSGGVLHFQKAIEVKKREAQNSHQPLHLKSHCEGEAFSSKENKTEITSLAIRQPKSQVFQKAEATIATKIGKKNHCQNQHRKPRSHWEIPLTPEHLVCSACTVKPYTAQNTADTK